MTAWLWGGGVEQDSLGLLPFLAFLLEKGQTSTTQVVFLPKV
jgi:hypothetical protein